MSKSPKQPNVLQGIKSNLLEKIDFINDLQSSIIRIEEYNLHLFMNVEKFEEHLIQLINKNLQIQ